MFSCRWEVRKWKCFWKRNMLSWDLMSKDAYFKCLVKLLAFFRLGRGDTKVSSGKDWLPTALVFFLICFKVWLRTELFLRDYFYFWKINFSVWRQSIGNCYSLEAVKNFHLLNKYTIVFLFAKHKVFKGADKCFLIELWLLNWKFFSICALFLGVDCGACFTINDTYCHYCDLKG